jgi:hypothetical protein
VGGESAMWKVCQRCGRETSDHVPAIRTKSLDLSQRAVKMVQRSLAKSFLEECRLPGCDALCRL